jgi:hypothetical protein
MKLCMDFITSLGSPSAKMAQLMVRACHTDRNPHGYPPNLSSEPLQPIHSFVCFYPMSALIGIYPKRQILPSDGVLVHVDPEVEVPQEHGHLYPSREELLQHSDVLLEGLRRVASYGAVLGHLVGDGVDDSLIQVRSKHSPVDKLAPC